MTWTIKVPMEWLRWKSPKVVFIGLSDTIACFYANVFFKSFSSGHSTYKSFPYRTYNPVIQADEKHENGVFQSRRRQNPNTPPKNPNKPLELVCIFVWIEGKGSTEKKSSPVHYLSTKLYQFTN